MTDEIDITMESTLTDMLRELILNELSGFHAVVVSPDTGLRVLINVDIEILDSEVDRANCH